MHAAEHSGGLSVRERVLYASPALVLAIVALPLHVFVPRFYTDVVGLRVATVGQVLLAARVFDAVSDPVVGALSDALRGRWARRRAFVALGSVPLALSVHALLAPPASGGVGWFVGAVFLVYLSWTLVVVPYEAMGIEETGDYDERTAVLGLREGLGLVGIVVALATPPLLAELLGLDAGSAGERERMRWFAHLYVLPLVLLCWACALGLRPRRPPPARSERRAGALERLRELARALAANRPFLVLVVAFALASTAAALSAALLLFFARYVIGLESGELFVLLYIGSGVVCAPAWIALARRREKRSAWLGALGMAAGAHAALSLLGAGDALAFAVLLVMAGVPFGGLMVLPSAMQADAVDFGEGLSGERSEGLHVGVWNVARKTPGALAVGSALWLLGASGYDANVEQTPAVLRTLRALVGAVPATLLLVALGLSLLYGIDRARHATIRSRLSG